MEFVQSFLNKAKSTGKIRRWKRKMTTPTKSADSSKSSSSSGLDSSTTPTTVLNNTNTFQVDEHGKLPRTVLEHFLLRLGTGESESQLAAVLAEADCDEDGKISLEGFLRPEITLTSEEEELREAFRVYDVNGDGVISAEEILHVLFTLGDDSCSINDCRRMIGVVDSDGDGLVCFSDFKRMMLTKGVGGR